jgi:hypothetical protein
MKIPSDTLRFQLYAAYTPVTNPITQFSHSTLEGELILFSERILHLSSFASFPYSITMRVIATL